VRVPYFFSFTALLSTMPAVDIIWWAALAKKLNLVALLTSFIPLAVGLRRWPTIGPAHRPLVWFAVVPGCLLGSLSEIGRYVFHNNIAFNHLGTLAETLVLSWAYWHALRAARYVALSAGAFVLVFAVESGYWHGFWRGENGYTHSFQTLLLLSFALLYFEQLLRDLHTISLEQDPMFLVSVGVMLYYAGTIMIFLLENGMQRLHQVNQIWTIFIIQATLLIIFNALLALALWWAGRFRPHSQPHV
jgi:hypothetical protein